LDSYVWVISAISILIGSWVQTALGFGLAVVAAPILVILNPEWVPIIITALALLLSIFNSIDQRHALEIRQLALPFITRLPGTACGAWLLLQLDTKALQIMVAACVLLAVIITAKGKQFSYSAKKLGLAAFISGITGTTTSIGGPPMALVMQHGTPNTVRANLSFYFVYSCIVSLLAYAYLGLITITHIYTTLSFLPVCILGYVTGIKSRPYVDAGRFRPLLLILCSISATIALLGTLLSD
jgi:uncharacterized membrane protein YfcA